MRALARVRAWLTGELFRILVFSFRRRVLKFIGIWMLRLVSRFLEKVNYYAIGQRSSGLAGAQGCK